MESEAEPCNIVNFFFKCNGASKNVSCDFNRVTLDSEFFYEKTWELYGIPPYQQCLRIDNVPILLHKGFSNTNPLPSFITVDVTGRLLGGKGGFGSLLRGQRGARKKIRNFDVCRDLNGRRLRHTKAVERLTAWLEKKRRDQALIDALGGDVSDTQPITSRQHPAITGNDCAKSSSSALEQVGQTYFNELEIVSDLTKDAVKDGLVQKKACESGER